MYAANFLLLSAVLFSIGVFGVIARRNAVMVLMSVELVLNSVNLNLVAFALMNNTIDGHVFALFVIAVAAAEVGVGLALVLIATFGRKQDNPAIVLSYAALEGVFLGAISFVLANVTVGGASAGALIGQAILGTIGVFFGMLFVVNRGWWFGWVILALGAWSVAHGARHALDARRGN